MFKVFSGSWRGIGANASPEVLFMQIGFEFRQHLHHFKGASLSVFMCVVLHANAQGESFPSYEQIQAETGLTNDTIGRAIKHLKNLSIEGQRVLLTYRLRDEKNRFVGGNRYIVFPTTEQLAEYEVPNEAPENHNEQPNEPEQICETEKENNSEQRPAVTGEKSQNPIFPNVENSESGKSVHKKNHSLRKIKNMGAAAPARLASNPEEQIAAFPADCQSGAKLVCSLFNLRPPKKPQPGQKGGDFALWVKGLRELGKTAAEYGVPLDLALQATWKRWNNNPFTVAHPGALAKTLTSVLASQTIPNENPAPLQSALEFAMQNFSPRS